MMTLLVSLAAEVFDPMAKAKAISDSLGFLWSSRKDEDPASEVSIPEGNEIEEKTATVDNRYTKQDSNGAGAPR